MTPLRPLLALPVLSFVLVGAPEGSGAATIVVTTLSGAYTEDGECSLSEAILSTSYNDPLGGCPSGDAGHDTIRIPLEGSITLGGQMEWIAEDLTIVGPGNGNLTVFGPSAGYTFRILSSSTVEIRDLRTGFAQGAVLSNSADLTLRNVTASFNRAENANGGAVKALGGTLHVENCTFAYNEVTGLQAEGTGHGGAIHSLGPTVVVGSEFVENSASRGGAVAVRDEDLSIHASLFEANHASSSGGALHYFSNYPKQVDIASTLFERNEAQISGGALYLAGGGIPAIRIEGSTFDRNSLLGEGGRGGAIATGYRPDVLITNSTFDGNSGPNGAAIGVNSFYEIHVSHSTLTDNTGAMGTLWSDIGGAQGTVESSIIWGNQACGGFGTIEFSGYNLLSDSSCGVGTEDIVGSDPLLAPLADNGGPVPTRYPGPSSPVVDSGAPVAPEWGMECLATDGRGLARPRNADGSPGGDCDRGAVERGSVEILIDGFESGTTSGWS